MKAFKEKVTQEILRRFTPSSLEIVNKPPLIASAIDPHYHQLKFLTDTQRSLVYEAIKEKFAEMFPEISDSEDIQETLSQKGRKMLWIFY